MNSPLFGLEKEIITQRQQNISVLFLSKKYKVSRQAIYDLLKKAEKNGENIPNSKRERKVSSCVICSAQYFGKSKTCGIDCRKKLISINNRKEDSKWSRTTLVDLVCNNCGKQFQRTKYQQSISISKKCYKKEIKENYCSTECYYNRSGVYN